jgi:starch synthase (maltosyl-transferring)
MAASPKSVRKASVRKIAANDGRRRAVIEGVLPEVDGGRFPIKRVLGDRIEVEADVFTDGHDAVRVRLLHRHESERQFVETESRALGNDRWQASFRVDRLGRYCYTIVAWVDRFLTWRRELARREDPADIMIALEVGAELLTGASQRARGADAKRLAQAAKALAAADSVEQGRALALDEELAALAGQYPDRQFESQYGCELGVVVDPVVARFGAWYELFPRSTSDDPGRHGTFHDVEKRLPYVADMGFDVLYLPPIHPVGRERRKGPNNTLTAGPNDPGSPWAIGALEGGHEAIHPELGTIDDFRKLVASARERDIEIALDIAFQCAPDHPWVGEHPEWFRIRPDGTVQYAENPPNKYQDIYPFDFESEEWQALHDALIGIVRHWVREGVRIFRVDNPHTKAFTLWERLITEVKAEHPEVLFLSEAFTRPRVMHRLAKLGFSQSYTYFAWRNTKWELEEYFRELAHDPSREYFRPNVWPNTPDILTEYLQIGARAAFMTRFVLAATLSSAYGIYGPAFELLEHRPREPGSEEYLDSEKYQIRTWDLERSDSLRSFIARVNRIRRENPALQHDWSLEFIPIDNEQMIAYTKTSPDGENAVVTVVNLDPHNAHSGWLELPLEQLGLDPKRPYRMHDLLGGGSYLWQGARNYVHLDPEAGTAHIFRVRRHVRTERDFDYFL